jgi:hypothetical protein
MQFWNNGKNNHIVQIESRSYAVLGGIGTVRLVNSKVTPEITGVFDLYGCQNRPDLSQRTPTNQSLLRISWIGRGGSPLLG